MTASIKKFESFIREHHVMTLATSSDNCPQVCNLFYTYRSDDVIFVVASDSETEHIRNVLANQYIAASIVLETKHVGKIQGLQIKGNMVRSEDDSDREAYFRAFPYARVMNPVLWKIIPLSMKLTDNSLGFGKKLNWSRGVSE